ncbi:MAG: LPS biosynthesis protein WbpP, partial [Desulfuromonadales bacterium]|nr:LPS biosynthesis protein WbpP [Desulfuromonadales bacterium]
ITVNRLFARIQTLLDSDIGAEHGPDRAGDIRHSFATIDKAKRLLDYRGEISFEEGLKRSLEWYVENLNRAVRSG